MNGLMTIPEHEYILINILQLSTKASMKNYGLSKWSGITSLLGSFNSDAGKVDNYTYNVSCSNV